MATLSITPVSQTSPDNNTVMCEIFIAAPRERVFQALTEPKQAVQWWGQNDRYHINEFNIDARVGGKWSASGPSTSMGNLKIHGEVLELDPPQRLAYTWISSWLPKTTTVLWELEKHDNGTLVKLTHTGFEGNAEHTKAHSIGWSLVLSWLQGYAEHGETVESRK